MRIARDAERVHPEQRDGHRRRDAEHDGDRAAHAAEEHGEQDRHDRDALGQVLEHRAQRALDELGAVVDDVDGDARRQLALDALHALADGAHDVAAVLAEQHHIRERPSPPRRAPRG